MFRLDNNFLIELGLGSLPADEKNKMLAHIYETLEMRVGMKLAEQMSDQQLNEFEAFIDRKDEAGALTWLETNFPNYKQVVADELEKLKGEIVQVAPQLVQAALAAAPAAAQPFAPTSPPPATAQPAGGFPPNYGAPQPPSPASGGFPPNYGAPQPQTPPQPNPQPYYSPADDQQQSGQAT